MSMTRQTVLSGHKRAGTYKCLITARKALEIFSPGCRLCDIDKKFCIAYRDWLLSYCSPRTGRPLAKKTAFSYFWQLADILSNAIYMGYIKNNPWKLLETSDKMTEPPTTRGFLTLEEAPIVFEQEYFPESLQAEDGPHTVFYDEKDSKAHICSSFIKSYRLSAGTR